MDEEQEDMSLSDLMGLVQQFEQSQQSSKPLFFDEDSYERIILFYQENREFKRALSVAETALEQYPYSPTFFILKAEVLAEQNQFEEALNILEIAETLDANEITIYLIKQKKVPTLELEYPTNDEEVEDFIARIKNFLEGLK